MAKIVDPGSRYGRAQAVCVSRRWLVQSGLAAGISLSLAQSTSGQASPAEPVEGQVRSVDGTSISFLKLGRGPGLVYSHGSLSTGEEWLPVADRLKDRFTSYVMTRRGRGRSDVGSSHSLEKECEDIAAVLGAAGPGAHLLGHSYGAVCALETARRTSIGKLVLYEPPLPMNRALTAGSGIPTFRADIEVFRAAIEEGRREDAMLLGVRRFIGLTETEIAALRPTPVWNELLSFAHTWLPELEALARLEYGVERFEEITAPTLLLVGALSPDHLKVASSALQSTLPNARTVLLRDQGHEAQVAVPDIVASEIARFAADA